MPAHTCYWQENPCKTTYPVDGKAVESPEALTVSTVPAATGLDGPEAVQVAGVPGVPPVAAVDIVQLVMALPEVDQSVPPVVSVVVVTA